ncbi:MAG: hypothetical protein GY884_22300 [Proteobacteria bacterium]|nr:hypothetical protein [Pseudomonadota bacterium]
MLDDWFHLSAIDTWLGVGERMPRYFEQFRDPWGTPNVFAFFHGDNAQWVESGMVPWWLDPALDIRFLRPLSTLTHVIDHQLFGTWAVGPHAHGILWYVASVVVVGLFLREVLPERIAWISTLLFALDDAHWYAALWIANRNALVALVPALLGLVAHIRWRRGWRPGLPLSVLGLALGLAGGEPALGVFALLLAYQRWGGGPAVGGAAWCPPSRSVSCGRRSTRASGTAPTARACTSTRSLTPGPTWWLGSSELRCWWPGRSWVHRSTSRCCSPISSCRRSCWGSWPAACWSGPPAGARLRSAGSQRGERWR